MMTPENVITLHPEVAIPIHYSDYDVFKSPLEDFQRAVKAAGFEQRVRYLKHGECFEFSVAGEAARELAGG